MAMEITRVRKLAEVVERGMLCGVGTTKTLAKADLEAKVEQAITGSYDPELITFDGETVLVHRTPQGWAYRAITTCRLAEDGVLDMANRSMVRGYDTREQAVQAAIYHAVSLSIRTRDWRTEGDLPAILTDPVYRQRVLATGRYERAYDWAKANMAELEGDIVACGRWATEHQNDSRFS